MLSSGGMVLQRDLVRGGDDIDELREPDKAVALDLLVVGLGERDLCRDGDPTCWSMGGGEEDRQISSETRL